MKATCLFLLMISCAAWTPGKAFVDPSSPASQQTSVDGEQQKDRKPSDVGRDHPHVSGRNHPNNPAIMTKLRPNHQRSAKPGGAPKGGFIQQNIVNNALPVRRSGVIRPSVPLLNTVHHHSANPAVLGGSASSDGRNTGAINGTRVHHRI